MEEDPHGGPQVGSPLARQDTHPRPQPFGMVRPIMGAAPRGGGHFVPTWCLTSGVARSVRYRPFCNLCSSCRGAGLPPRHAGCPAHHSVCGDRRPLWGGKHGPVASVAETRRNLALLTRTHARARAHTHTHTHETSCAHYSEETRPRRRRRRPPALPHLSLSTCSPFYPRPQPPRRTTPPPSRTSAGKRTEPNSKTTRTSWPQSSPTSTPNGLSRPHGVCFSISFFGWLWLETRSCVTLG
jgi:hypothetical protein